MQVFFCSIGGDVIRYKMAQLCVEWWIQDGNEVTIVNPEKLGCTVEAFQSVRRIWANQHAKDTVYVLADDDCLPVTPGFTESMLQLMDQYPSAGILTPWPTNAVIQRWTPEGYQPLEDDNVMEHISTGNIRFSRKHHLSWPAQRRSGYDMEHCAMLREDGLISGYARNIKMNHLGEGYTQTWRTS